MPALDSSDQPASAAGGSGRSPADEQRAPAVHVRFSPSQGRRLRRSEPSTCGEGRALWTDRPLLMQRADGTYELIGTSDNLAGLARWILSHGADAEVQGPERLRRRVAAEARRVLRQYSDR